MQSLYILALFPLTALAMLNGRCSGNDLWGERGICIRTSTCRGYGGEYKSGACPDDPTDVKCCLVGAGVNSENDPCGGISYCNWIGNPCGGYFRSGYCPGGANYKCCYLG